MAEALYRKYRPQVFEDMVGQEHIERTLKNAIDQDKVSHAYLFCGPRGTGKTTTARLLAKALLCESGPTSSPDGTCRDCREVADGVHPDVYELDAASRTGVENVREEIIGRVNFAPTRGKKKIYIIDEVHMLSTAAFNALLKTLEEPPSHVVFVLCTTDPQKVPATIHSRCQRFDFHRLGTDEIVSRLGAVCMGEGVEFEGDALALIAHRADGGMRNALTALEQLIAFGDGNVTVQGAEDLLGSLDSSDMAEIVRAVGQRDVAACFNWTAGYVESGADLAQFARDMAQRVRNLYVMSLAGTDVALDVPDAERRELAEELHLFGPDRLARLLGLLGDLVSELRTASNPRLCFEVALTRMVRPDSDLTLEALAERIEALEAGKSAVATYMPASEAAPPAAQSPSQAETTQEGSALASVISNPAALQRAWRSVITAVKKERVSYGVLFVNVRVRAEEDGSGVVMEFPADNPFAFAMASKPEVQEMIAAAFQQVVGEPVPCRYVQANPAPSAAAPSAPVPLSQTASTSQSHPAPAQPSAVSDPVASDSAASGSAASNPASVASRAPFAQQQPGEPAVSSRKVAAAASEQPNVSERPVVSLDDEVPLDVYDGMASSYDDEYAGCAPSYDDPGNSWDSARSNRVRPDQAPIQRPTQAEPARNPIAAEVPSASSWPGYTQPQDPVRPSPTAPVESTLQAQVSTAYVDDYSKMISNSMGIDIVFKEVDE